MARRDPQQAALDRLRAKGNHLAPVMVDGKVRPKGSDKSPASGGVLPAVSAPQGSVGVITRWDDVRPADRRTAPQPGEAFELLIPAPAEFLNENQRLHWAERAKRVKAWRHAADWLSAGSGMPTGLGQLRIDAYVIKPRANRFDPANWMPTAKACVDGLVDYGLMPDDNRHHLAGPFMHDGGKGEPALRIVVTVLDSLLAAS